MRPHDIQCRCCHERYNSTEFGCDICLPAKQNIIWPEADLPLLESILAHSIRLVSELAEDLEHEIKAARKKRGRMAYLEHVKIAKMLSDANTTLVAEARKLRKEESQVAKNLSWDQKAEMIVNVVDTMPSDKRANFLRRLTSRIMATEAELVRNDRVLPAHEDE